MKKKSLGVTILGIAAVILSNSFGIGGPVYDVVIGILVSAIAMSLKLFSNSGEWLKGASPIFWVTNSIGIVLMILGSVSGSADVLGITESGVSVISKVVILLNAVVIGLGTTTEINKGDVTIGLFQKK